MCISHGTYSANHALTLLSMGRKCIFVASKELAWVLSIEPEQLEMITAFVGGRDIFAVVT